MRDDTGFQNAFLCLGWYVSGILVKLHPLVYACIYEITIIEPYPLEKRTVIKRRHSQHRTQSTNTRPHQRGNVTSWSCFVLHLEKAELFLELFGNSLVRAQTADYLRQKANDLIK